MNMPTTYNLASSIAAVACTDDDIVVTIDTVPAVWHHTCDGQYVRNAVIRGFGPIPVLYGKIAAINTTTRQALIGDTANNHSYLLNIDTLQLIKMIRNPVKPTLCVYSDDGSYFAIAGKEGDVVCYETLRTKEILLRHHHDEISCLAFAPDNRYLAVAVYDRSVTIYDVKTHHAVMKFTVKAIVEALVFTQETQKVICFERGRAVELVNIQTRTIAMGDMLDEWPTCVRLCAGGRLVLVATRSSLFYLVCSATGRLVAEYDGTPWGVNALSVTDRYIIAGGITGDLSIRHLLIDEAIGLLNARDISALCRLIAHDPFLLAHQSLCRQIEENAQEILAHQAQSPDEHIGLERMLTLLNGRSVLRHDLLAYLYKRDDIVNFTVAVENRQLLEACAIAHREPLLKYLHLYRPIRHACRQRQQRFWRQLEEHPGTLPAMSSVPEECHTCQHGLFSQKELLHNTFVTLYDQWALKNVEGVLAICAQHPLMKRSAAYRTILAHAERLVEKFFLALAHGQRTHATALTERLARIAPFAPSAHAMTAHVRALDDLHDAATARDLEKLFSLAESYPALRTNPLLISERLTYENDIVPAAMEAAKTGDMNRIDQILGAYKNCHMFEATNLAIIKTALLCEIIRFAPADDKEQALTTYLHSFGRDTEVERLSQELGLTLPVPPEETPPYATIKNLRTLLPNGRMKHHPPEGACGT